MRTALLVACFASLAPVAHAGIYKCALDRGEVFYQEDPCPPGRELRDLEKDPATVSVVPFSPPSGTTTRQVAPSTPKARAEARSEPRTKKSALPAGNATQRKFLRPGIGEGEVVAKVGPPDMTSGGKGRKTTRWTYMPTGDDPSTITTLTFEYGRVVEVERKVVR
jgi:uncharacterized protein DUF4124